MKKQLSISTEREETDDLQLDTFALQLDRTNLEVDPDRRDETRRPCVVAEPQQEARFTDT